MVGGVGGGATHAAQESLAAAACAGLSDSVLAAAEQAFADGLRLSALITGITVAAMAVISWLVLRRPRA